MTEDRSSRIERVVRAMDDSHDVYDLRSLHRMKSLCQMLRNNADKILAAETSITITTTTLYQLNEAVDNLQDGLSPPDLSLDLEDGRWEGSGGRLMDLEEWNLSLQLVLDIVSKAPVLVLYKPKVRDKPATNSSSSPSSSNGLQPLRLGYFTSLNHLEMSCVPIQAIQDMLKMRERLQTLVVVSCFTANFKLQDVLEMCDGDVSVPMQWSVLTYLCLRRNYLNELDGSLRLCPRLEMLDLSRNCLTTTDVYLGYLMELSHLDLSYNGLTELPSVSATAKKKLRVLRLTGNKISSLAGLEEMTSLQELDVSENILSSHDALLPLKGLHRLDELNVKGCPACMKRNHRLHTLHYISTVSLSRKFSLDGRPVTHKEIQNSRAVQQNTPYYPHTYPSPYHQQSLRHADITRPEERGPLTAGNVRVSTPRKKKSRKKAKTRTMDIPDMDTGGSSRDVTPSTTPRAASRLETLAELRRQQVQETREEMEHLRRYYGESWLQAVEDKGILPRPQSTNTITTNAQTSQNPRKSRSGETDVHGEKITTTAELHVHTATSTKNSESSPKSTKNLGSSPNSAKNSGSAPGKSSRMSAESKSAILTIENPQTLADRVFDKDNMFLSSSSGAEDGGANEVHGKDVLSKRTSRQSEEGVYPTSAASGGESLVREEGGEAERETEKVKETEGRSCVVYTEQDSMVEPENQSEPFIVTLPDNHDDPFIITVSERYLVEKDINGVMQDMLDLQSVEALRTAVGKTVHDANMDAEDHDDAESRDLQEIKVILEFGYIRKDRRSRVYVMEDESTAQLFSQLVQPFIDAKQQAALKKLQVKYQCLKCNSQFSKGEATVVVNRERIPHTGSIRDFSSMADIGGEKVTLQCPKCQSDHIVQLETDHHHPPPSPLSSSPSSLPSDGLPHPALMRKQSFDQLTSQSPRAHSTPVKQKRHSFDVNSSRPLDRKASWSNALRSLFEKDSSDESTVKQETENLPKSRHRSNAFYDQPLPSRLRSDAVVSPAEFINRRASGSVASHSSDVDKPDASSDVVDDCHLGGLNVHSSNSSQLATFGALNNQHLSASSNSSGFSPARTVVSSAESDIAILNKVGDSGFLNKRESDVSLLNKRDSTASVEVLSRQVMSDASQSDVQQTDNCDRLTNVAENVTGDNLASHETWGKVSDTLKDIRHEFVTNTSERGNDVKNTLRNKRRDFVMNTSPNERSEPSTARNRNSESASDSRNKQTSDYSSTTASDASLQTITSSGREKLTPVQQESDSVEVTPLGSPLSSSICSSMVSSVYHNSLLPNTSASDIYVTASENDITGERRDDNNDDDGDDDDQHELSIYDQTDTSPVRVSSHKASVSSEVEVLMVEEATHQNGADSGDSFTLTADGGETSTTMLDDTAAEPAFLSSIESRAATAAESVTGLVSSGESEGYDFKHLDHRLALYLMMTVFDNSEEFKFKVKTGVSQYMVFEEYDALVAVTNLKLYILRINTEDSSVELSEGLTLMEAQPHAELRRVDVGLGRQTLRLEYSSDCSSYTLIIRDTDKLDSLLELLSDQLQSYGMETGVPMSVVFHEDVDQQTMDTLTADVLDKGGNSQQILRLYSLGYIARGHNPQYPIAFVVSSSEVCLVRTNQQWPSPVHQAPLTVEIVGKQFTVLERQKINNIATVEIHDENSRWLRITFFNETSGDETRWLVSMETVRGAKELVEAVREPWEDEFGVEMDLEESLFDLDCHI